MGGSVSSSVGEPHDSASPSASASASISSALRLVSPTPIDCFSTFWQFGLNELSFSSLNEDAESVAETLDHATREMIKHTEVSGNLRTMCMVLCMALEQYPTVIAYQDAERRRSNTDTNSNLSVSPESPTETLADYFSRTYSPHSNAIDTLSSLSPWTSYELKSISSSPTPDWLLNLTFLIRVFMQHVVTMEYGRQKQRIIALRNQHIYAQMHGGHMDEQPAPPPIHSDLSYRLIHALLTVLTDLPTTNATMELHIELSSLLLVLFSTQVYVPLSVLYSDSNLFLSHALLGPVARRAPQLMAKLLANATRTTETLAANQVHSSTPRGRHASSNSIGGGGRQHHQLLTVSAMSSPSQSDLRSGNVTPLSPPPAADVPNMSTTGMIGAGTSLSAQLTHLAGQQAMAEGRSLSPANNADGQTPNLLKRLGSKLVSLLLLPVQLYRFLFSLVPSTSTYDHDPLGHRSALLLLLLTHQSCALFETREDELIQDADGRERQFPYVHGDQAEFDWRRWREEGDKRPPPIDTPFVPSVDPAHAASSIRSTAAPPPVFAGLNVRISSPSTLVAASIWPCPTGINPYKRGLSLLVDDAWEGTDEEPIHVTSTPTQLSSSRSIMTPPTHLNTPPSISFAALYELLTLSTRNESSTLLLYSLLHSNSAFKEFILVKSDIDLLVLPYLAILYEEYGQGSSLASSARRQSHSRTPLAQNRIYMVLILFLILSKDRGFVDTIHRRLILKRVPFYHDSHLANISLGSTMMLVLLKTLQSNLYAPRDSYVHTNCLAILSNIAPPSDFQHLIDPTHAAMSTHGGHGHHHAGIKLHQTVCLKLVALLSTLSKKYAKLVQREKEQKERNNQKQHHQQQQPHQPPQSTSQLDESRINLARPIGLSVNTSDNNTGVLNDPPVEPSPSSAPTNGLSDDPVSSHDAIAELSSFSSFIRLLLDLLLSFLTGPHLSSNTYLLYSLLQRSDVLEPFRAHSGFWELAGQLEQLTTYFRQRLEAHAVGEEGHNPHNNTGHAHCTPRSANAAAAVGALGNLSIDALLHILKQEVKSYKSIVPPNQRMRTQFSYEEQASAEDYFIPFIWRIMREQQDLLSFADQMIVIFPTGDELDDAAAHTDGVDGDLSSHDDARLKAELEQIHLEHALQQQIGSTPSAQPTPHAHTRNIQHDTPHQHETNRPRTHDDGRMRNMLPTTTADASSAINNARIDRTQAM